MIIKIIIIITTTTTTLFRYVKEDTIFGKYVSLTHGPLLTNVEMQVGKMNRQYIFLQ